MGTIDLAQRPWTGAPRILMPINTATETIMHARTTKTAAFLAVVLGTAGCATQQDAGTQAQARTAMMEQCRGAMAEQQRQQAAGGQAMRPMPEGCAGMMQQGGRGMEGMGEGTGARNQPAPPPSQSDD
jgi:hypothetical protein